MVTIHVKKDELITDALYRFKKQCVKAGILKELKKRRRYEKPSVRRHRKKRNNKKKGGNSDGY